MSEANCGAAASLSLNHNSDGTSELPFKLTGSQAKTAYAIQVNIETMIELAGIERVGFLTLTVGDYVAGKFRQVWDASEASRRINNLNRRVLPALFSRAVVVTERHKSGAIHFHIVGAMANGADIRTGFDHEAHLSARQHRKWGNGYEPHERRYIASATPELKAAWAMLRDTLPGYGFGRSELTPIRKSGEAIAGYVAKYLRKNLEARRDEDKGKKLVRYLGWKKEQMTANGFAWATPRAAAWRGKAATLAGMVNATRETVAAAFGARWSFKLTRLMHAFNEAANTDRSQDLKPLKFDTYPERFTAKQIIRREVNGRWLDRADISARARWIEWRGPQGRILSSKNAIVETPMLWKEAA